MTEAPVDSTREPQDDTALPVPAIASEASAAPVADKVAEELARIAQQSEERFERLEKMVRGVQSGVDKRLERMAKNLNVEPSKLAEVVEQADRDELLEELLSERRASRKDLGRSFAEELKAETRQILDRAGVPYNDPEVAALARNTYPTKAAYFTDVGKVLASKTKLSHAGPAAAVVEGGTAPPPKEELDRDALKASLDKAMKTGDLKKLPELREKMRAALG